MNRHWKGLTAFVASGLFAFILSLMVGSYVLAIASIVGTAILVASYAAGEADFRGGPYDKSAHRHRHA